MKGFLRPTKENLSLLWGSLFIIDNKWRALSSFHTSSVTFWFCTHLFFSFLFSSPPYPSSLFQFLLILYHVCICTAHARGCAHTDGKRKKTDEVFHPIMHAINYIHNKLPANLSSMRVCFGLGTSVCIHRHTHTHTHMFVSISVPIISISMSLDF